MNIIDIDDERRKKEEKKKLKEETEINDFINSSKTFQAYQLFGAVFLDDPEDPFVYTPENKEKILDYFSDDEVFDPEFLNGIYDQEI